MHTHLKTPPAARARRQELKALESLDSTCDIEAALARIATSYGKVESISQLVLSNEHRRAEHVFFINFTRADDALLAARDLDGLLYGFSALVVTVPRNGFGRLS